MMLFDADGKIRRYESPEAILEEFAVLRLAYYSKRKDSLLAVSAPQHSPAANTGGISARRKRALFVTQTDIVYFPDVRRSSR